MKISNTQLKEMVRKIVKKKLQENNNQYNTYLLSSLDPNEMSQVQQWLAASGEIGLPPELLNKLTEMYIDEMPLDVQQGNSGTPEEWLFSKLDYELSAPMQEAKIVRLSPNQLTEMIRGIITTEILSEADKKKDDKMPAKWVQYMKDVEDMLADVVDKAKKLRDEGEELKTEERELDTVANPINSARGNHYDYIDERSTALKMLVSELSTKLEIWKTKYEG